MTRRHFEAGEQLHDLKIILTLECSGVVLPMRRESLARLGPFWPPIPASQEASTGAWLVHDGEKQKKRMHFIPVKLQAKSKKQTSPFLSLHFSLVDVVLFAIFPQRKHTFEKSKPLLLHWPAPC